MNNSSLVDDDSINDSTFRRRLRSRASSNDNRVTLIEFDNNDHKSNDNDIVRKSTKRFKPIKRELEVAHETPDNWEKVGIFTVKQIK